MSRRPRSAGKSSDTFIPPRAGDESVARRLAEGELIAGPYRVLSFVAEGAMGSVYAVEDQSLRERVALKTIRVQGVSAPRMVKRFKRELRLARRVTHPNVCRVFDLGEHTPAATEAGEASSFAFLTMEFLEGETLEAYLRRQGRMAPEHILPLAEQMAAALDAAHAARVIHRDFKSGNVMLVPTRSGALRAVVTDFGLARGEGGEDDVSAQEGILLGSLGYMAPEQVECRTLSPASDLYSFGVVLFEMVTGQLPFVGDTPMVMAIKRLFEPPPSPGSQVSGLAASWDAALRRCLARQPEDRFPTASRVVEALRGASPSPGASPPELPSSTPFVDMMSPLPPGASKKPSKGTARREVRGVLPTHPEAERLYAEGLLALRGHESPLAIPPVEGGGGGGGGGGRWGGVGRGAPRRSPRRANPPSSSRAPGPPRGVLSSCARACLARNGCWWWRATTTRMPSGHRPSRPTGRFSSSSPTTWSTARRWCPRSCPRAWCARHWYRSRRCGGFQSRRARMRASI